MRDLARNVLTAAALGVGLACAAGPAAAASQALASVEEPGPLSATAALFRDWILASGDNDGHAFAIVDKHAAQVLVFAPDGRLKGAAPALIGSARGDDSVPGIGDRPLESIRPHERTTPAGRFLAAYGPAHGGKDVLWVDYDTAVSLHPVVTGNPRERRLQRLRSPSPDDNRITYGCINVATAFYEAIVRPTFRKAGGVFYVLPEEAPMAQVFPAFQRFAAASQPRGAYGSIEHGLSAP